MLGNFLFDVAKGKGFKRQKQIFQSSLTNHHSSLIIHHLKKCIFHLSFNAVKEDERGPVVRVVVEFFHAVQACPLSS